MVFTKEFSNKYFPFSLLPYLLTYCRQSYKEYRLNTNCVQPISTSFNLGRKNSSSQDDLYKYLLLPRKNLSNEKSFEKRVRVLNVFDDEVQSLFVEENLLGAFKDFRV